MCRVKKWHNGAHGLLVLQYIDYMENNQTQMTIQLTAKETSLLSAIKEGMDNPGCGWLHELADETRATAGILGSLVKKGLVTSHAEKTPGYPTAYWVELV